MTHLIEGRQQAGILQTYAVSITEDNCKAMCVAETACVAAAHSASTCWLFDTIEQAEYEAGVGYFVKDCRGMFSSAKLTNLKYVEDSEVSSSSLIISIYMG